MSANWPSVPNVTVWGFVHRLADAPVTVPWSDHVLAVPVGVRVRVTGTWLPSESKMLVEMVTGLVPPLAGGRLPPMLMLSVWLGASADP